MHYCITIMIRVSETDLQKAGVSRPLTGTKCDICLVFTMAKRLGLKGWRPNNGEFSPSRNIANRINHTLKELSPENGLGAKRFPTHTLRVGCATTLYASGVDPIDIQRWDRRQSAIYMRYIWHDNLRVQHLSQALAANARLAEHLRVDMEMGRRVNFENEIRDGGNGKSNEEITPLAFQKCDFCASPERGEKI